jgi:transcriptional regulator with XRE-family HTH domain
MKKGTISRNIGLLMEHFSIRSVAQLAKLIGMPPTTLNKLTTGISPDPKISTLIPLADYFKISLDTLLSDHPVFTHQKSPKQFDLLVPLLSYNELPDMHEHLESLTVKTWPQWYPIPFQKKNDSSYYAVYTTLKQLPAPLDEASILIVKNESQLTHHTYSLIKHLNDHAVTIKKIVCDSGKQWLLPLHSELPPSEFSSKECCSLGTLQAVTTDMSNGKFVFIGEKNG